MSEDGQVDVLIVGAGLTGLAVARHLVGRGLRVAVLEQEAQVGGLARTVEREGCRVDLGGHRLYFQDPELFAQAASWIGEDRLLRHARRSSAYLSGEFLKYPPEFKNSVTIATLLAKALWEAASLRGGAHRPRSLKDWVLANFGPTIHETYFRQYTRKVWGLETEDMSAIWAEKRIGGLNVLKLIRETAIRARNKEAISQFHYPRGGIGALCDGLSDQVRSEARVITGAELLGIDGGREMPGSAHVRSADGESRLGFRYLVSTIPVSSLAQALSAWRPEFGSMTGGIKYRDMIIVGAVVSRRPVFEEHWVYFPEEGVPFSRVCESDNWSPGMAPGTGALLACEFFCDRGDRLWDAADAELGGLTSRALAGLGLVGADEIRRTFVLRVPYAYPLLYLGYEKALAPLLAALEAVPNIWLAGRTGTHAYFDMEECLEDARRAATEVLAACHVLRKA